MKNFSNKEIGNIGEEYAAKYLKKHKYKIIMRNFSCYYGEIDIIAESKNYLAFVEVKTRSENSVTRGSDSVTKQKQRHIINSAESFLKNYPTKKFVRLDICEVYLKSDSLKLANINYIKNAFEREGDYAPF